MLGVKLKEVHPGLVIRPKAFRFIPSVDIDSAFAFRHKGITRALGGFINSIRKRDAGEVKERFRVLARRQQDPFDTYDCQLNLWKKYHLQPYYFILYADYGTYDRNIPVNNRYFKNLIRRLADYATVGVHPSYASSQNRQLLKKEVTALSKVLRREVYCSRQHFLRLELPVTYRNLINHDITDDFTMGYAEVAGFRASICTPFRFYDIDLETETALTVHPFAVMDGTLKDYLHLSPEQAIELIGKLLKEVKAVGGIFMPLWHNQSFSDLKEWTGWKMVFEKMLHQALDQKAAKHANLSKSAD
jgi:hypothetical protein